MVKQIKAATESTLSTADRVWNVFLLIGQAVASVILLINALDVTVTAHRVGVVAVASVLGANVVLTLFRLQRDK